MTMHPPLWLQNDSYTGAADRALFETLWSREGVIGDGDLLVSERALGQNMSVDVAPGRVVIASDTAAGGWFVAWSDAVESVPIVAADPSLDRVDAVIATVRDSTITGADDDWIFDTVEGTPAASDPDRPAIPDRSIVVGWVLVRGNTASILDADCTDARMWARLGNGNGRTERVMVTASGTFRWRDYPGLQQVRATVLAGGGEGASAGGDDGDSGGGGGGGGFAEVLLDVTDLEDEETCTVGAGGSGAVQGPNPGNPGQTSQFGAHAAATGGQGGATNDADSQRALGGVAGVGTVGDVLLPGCDGGPGYNIAAGTPVGSLPRALTVGGAGGPSPRGWSPGTPPSVLTSGGSVDGLTPGGYGGGGQGGVNDGGGVANGGNGDPGVIVLDLFY